MTIDAMAAAMMVKRSQYGKENDRIKSVCVISSLSSPDSLGARSQPYPASLSGINLLLIGLARPVSTQ